MIRCPLAIDIRLQQKLKKTKQFEHIFFKRYQDRLLKL